MAVKLPLVRVPSAAKIPSSLSCIHTRPALVPEQQTPLRPAASASTTFNLSLTLVPLSFASLLRERDNNNKSALMQSDQTNKGRQCIGSPLVAQTLASREALGAGGLARVLPYLARGNAAAQAALLDHYAACLHLSAFDAAGPSTSHRQVCPPPLHPPSSSSTPHHGFTALASLTLFIATSHWWFLVGGALFICPACSHTFPLQL